MPSVFVQQEDEKRAPGEELKSSPIIVSKPCLAAKAGNDQQQNQLKVTFERGWSESAHQE
jgi:hypothetical protein